MKGTETVTVVRKPKVDRLKPTSASSTEHDITKCIVWPRASYEQDQGWVQISGFSIFAPPDSDILAEDQIRVRGELHSVIGVPGDYRKRGKRKGLLITTERVA